MSWHDPIVLIPAMIAWNGFFFGMVKYLFDRAVKTIDARLEAINEIDRRLIHVEIMLKQPPQCSQHSEYTMNTKALHTRLDGIGSKVDKLSGSLEGINRAVDLMNQFLIEQGGKK